VTSIGRPVNRKDIRMAWHQEAFRILLIGIGATNALDTWAMLLRRLGVPVTRMELVGRWFGHLLRGRIAHAAIAQSAPIPAERAWGWAAHYAIGIAFAALLVGLQGAAWLHAPTLLPALAMCLATAAMPLFVMQPAMGAGFASSRTATPIKNCLRSVAGHAVFGLGLYLNAAFLARLHG
jgi:hypothetical protein